MINCEIRSSCDHSPQLIMQTRNAFSHEARTTGAALGRGHHREVTGPATEIALREDAVSGLVAALPRLGHAVQV